MARPAPRDKALELAEQLGLYAYDAYVLEAVRAYRVPLLTTDSRLRGAAAQLGLQVWEALAGRLDCDRGEEEVHA
ncbi:MAG TPA: hypothetical protein VEP50_09110 [bacterium]|nr:hypothetical protein [bacterium]